MSAFHILKISIPLPGRAEPEEGWHAAFTQDLDATGAYHEITRDGLLARLPAGETDEGPPEEAAAGVLFTGDLRFDAGVFGGTGGAFAARLDEGRVKWAERLDYARFGGRARLYYAEGHPIAMTDDEYRERRRADHEETLTEDHAVSASSPRAASDGGGVMVETRSGARFRVAPEGDLPLPKPGDEVRLYLSPGRAHAPATEVVGVNLNGEPVYYEPPEEYVRRSARRLSDGGDDLAARMMQPWWDPWPLTGRSGSSAYGVAQSEGRISFPNYPEAERRAQRSQETHEEAHRQAQRETLRLLSLRLNPSHDDTRSWLGQYRLCDPSDPHLDLGRRVEDWIAPWPASGTEGEDRPVDPWTGRPLDEGEPEAD